MADDGILGLLGRMNDPAALYGGALNDPATRQAMAGRGLLAMAGSFADSAMPTRMPTPFGAVLGHAAGAAGASDDALMAARLQNAQAQQAMANVGVLNQMGPAYQMYFEAAKKEQERLAALAAGGPPGSGIPSAPPPGITGTGTGAGKPPTGPIDPELVTWHAKNLGLDPLLAHASMDIESSYGKDTGNKVSPSNTGAFQRAPADAPGGQNDTFDNQVKLGVTDLVTARVGLRASLGREPTNAEVYLAHQQGVSGATKLITNPDTPAGKLVRPVNISNNGGERFVNAPASAFVQHWAQEYNRREGKFASLAAPPPNATIAQAPLPPPGGVTAAGPPVPPGGLLNMPDLTGRMNAPIPGIAGGVAPAAPSLAPPATPPGAAAAAGPRSAGEMLVAANQATSATGGLPPLPPGLVQTADASGQVPLPGGLMVGGKAIPGLLGGAAPPPPQTAEAPVPPAARPPVPAPAPPAPAPAAPPMAGPPGAPPPLNLPPLPPMPGGVGGMGPPVQPTPLQLIAQGIVGLSSLTGHPAPEFMQKLAGQPLEMQMEAYKAYVGAQANQLTAQYQKQLDASAARYIAYETSQGNLPADLTKMTAEQGFKLRNDMLTQHGLVQGKDGHWQIDPVWLDAQAQKAAATARGPAEYKTVEVTVPDDPANPNGPQHKQTMTEAQFRDYTSGRGGPSGAGSGTAGIISGTGGTAGVAPGLPGQPIYTPGREEELKGIGQTLGKEYATVATDQTNAQKAKPYLLSIQQALQVHNDTGAGGAAKLDAWKAYMSGMQMVGLPVSSQLQDWIKNGEIIGKSGTQLGFELAKTLGSNEASTVVDQAVRNNPGLMTTAAGNKALIGLMSAIIDHTDAKREFYDDWVDPNKGKHTSLVGAQTAFNKANPWEVTISQFAPYQADKLGEEGYKKLPPGVKVVRPDGHWWIKPPAGQQPQVQ